MRKVILIVLIIINYHSIGQEKTAITIGESITITSEILKQDRSLNIYLPESFDAASTKKYDVIYLLDGGMDEDFLHISGLVQFANFSWISMIPETIVVGIVNVDRKHDLTYLSSNELDKTEFPTSGGSADFIQFITKELQPYIDKNYPVSDTKTIIGQSLGGLLASEILIKHPSAFNNYIIVSPSIWWDDDSILKVEPVKLDGFKNIHISVGKEGPAMETGATRLHYNLLQAYKGTAAINYEYLKEQDHGDALHLSVYKAFQMFSKNANTDKK